MEASRRTQPPVRSSGGSILAFTILLALGACAQISELLPFKTKPPPDVAGATIPRSDFQPLANAEHARVAPRVHSANNNPKQLVGLSPTQLTRVLGDPTFVRRDGRDEIWHYREGECILHLFLYQNGRNVSVEYVELRRTNDGAVLGTPIAEHLCLGELLIGDRTI